MIKRIWNSITLKWMIFSILLATVPLAAAGLSIIHMYQKELKKSVIMKEEMKADLVVERTEAFFERVTNTLFSLATEEHLGRSAFSSHVRNHMEKLLYQNDYLVELALLDEKGRETIKVSKHEVIGPKDLRDRAKSEMFGITSKGRIYYGDFFLTADMVPTVVLALPFRNERTGTMGVLSSKIHLRYLWNLLPQTQIGERGLTFVVNDEGDLIAHPDTRKVLLGLNVRHLPMVDHVVRGRDGVLEFKDLQGEKSLGVFKPMKKQGWGVVVQVPLEEAYKPVKDLVHHAAKGVLAVLIVAAVLSLFLARRLTLPIMRIAHEMKEVAKGNLDIQIRPTTGDELGRLTETFNQMIQDLKLSREALSKAEKNYEMVFENSKDMVYIASRHGKFIDVNPAGVEMLGYENREKLLQTTPEDIYFNIGDRSKFWEVIGKDGFIKDFEVKLKRKDGSPIDVLITANARRNDSGQVIGYEGFVKDISDRKRMEEELLRRTGELQTLHELGSLINRSLDLNQVLTLALDKLLDLTGFEMGGIYLLQEDGETLEFKYHRGYSPRFVERVRVIKMGEGISGKAIQEKKPIGIHAEKYPTAWISPFLEEEGIQYSVGIPLFGKALALGAINLSTRFPHIHTQREVDFLENIGNQIGLALENAQLFSGVAKAKSEWEITFDAVTDLITIRDHEYRILRANRAALKRFGISPKEMMGKRCYEILHRQAFPCEGCYVTEALQTKRPASGQRESEYLKGVFQYYTFPVLNEGGEIVAVVDLAREITEEKRIEKEKEIVNNINRILASNLDMRQVIRVIHSELREVLDSDRMTIALLDERGEAFRYFTSEREDAGEELSPDVLYPKKGTPFEEAVNTGFPVRVGDTNKSDSWIDQKLFEEGILSSLVFPLAYRGKTIGTLNFGSKKTNHFSEDHISFLHQVGTGLGISIENSLLLDRLRESEERYRTLVESAHDGVLVVGEDFRLRYGNERLAEILGYPLEQLTGEDFRNYLDHESRQMIADRYVRRQRGEEVPSRYEFSVLRKDGEVRNTEGSFTIIKDSKGHVNTVGFVKDITEKKKMEEQLIQTEKLRAMGEMASGVAHDFNNALAVILGNTQLLLQNAKDEELKESLRIIEKVTRDSAQTVRRLQDFTRKRIHRELFQVDLNSVVKDAIEITKPKWKDETQARGCRIEMIAALGQGPIVVANAAELREVVTNLIFNAIEAMPKGGKIEIRSNERGGRGCIQVSDTGIGMSEKVKQRIFEPFFTTKPFSNTGLGLSMAYGIVKRLGGDIEVESKEGRGTTFTVSFPKGGKETEEVTSSTRVTKGRKASILVIDDEESVRTVLSRMLAQVDHQVTVAESGEEGLRLFREKRFDMVLTDLGMPNMLGWEVCKGIKGISPRCPVGMITGWGMEVDQEKMEESGLDFVISKPFDFNQILVLVDEAIASRDKQGLN